MLEEALLVVPRKIKTPMQCINAKWYCAGTREKIDADVKDADDLCSAVRCHEIHSRQEYGGDVSGVL